jgi:hypothetical protein
MSDTIERLKNANAILIDLSRNTEDVEILAEIANIRSPIVYALTEIEFFQQDDTDEYAEETLAEVMVRIKVIRDQIEGAATQRSPVDK